MVAVHLKSPITLNPPVNEADLLKYPDNSNIKTVYRISKETQTDIIYSRSVIEIWGLRVSIKEAYKKLIALEWIKKNLKHTKLQIELREEYQEFYRGRGDGKLNKIIGTSGCSLFLQQLPLNTENFIIDVTQLPERSFVQAFQLAEVRKIWI